MSFLLTPTPLVYESSDVIFAPAKWLDTRQGIFDIFSKIMPTAQPWSCEAQEHITHMFKGRKSPKLNQCTVLPLTIEVSDDKVCNLSEKNPQKNKNED